MWTPFEYYATVHIFKKIHTKSYSHCTMVDRSVSNVNDPKIQNHLPAFNLISGLCMQRLHEITVAFFHTLSEYCNTD